MDDDSIVFSKKVNPIAFYEQSLETLSAMQDEDRLALFTVLGMLINELNDVYIEPEERTRQDHIINNILQRYDIKSLEDLRTKTDECYFRMNNRDLLKSEPMGDVQ